MNNIVFRLPVLALANREPNQRSIEEQRRILGCNANLRLKPGDHGLSSGPTNHFLYFIPDDGSGGLKKNPHYHHQFCLVEVGQDYQETILDKGDISGSRIHFGPVKYTDFTLIGEKLGQHKIYTAFAEIGC